MAHVQKYHVSEILKDVYTKMQSVSKSIFIDHRPTAKREQMKDLLVISIPSYLEEQNAWQKGFLRIELIVRDKEEGIPDMTRLDSMLNDVTAKFPLVTSRYSATSPKLIMKGDDGLGFTTWIIQSKLIINTIDSYQK